MKCSLMTFEGFVGTGKSTLSRMLAKELQLPRVDTDDILKSLQKSCNWGNPGYVPSEEAKRLVVMLSESILQSGSSLILEAGSYDKWFLPEISRIRAKGIVMEHYAFMLHAPLNVCAERAERRSRLNPLYYILNRKKTLDLKARWDEQEQYDREGLIHLDGEKPVDILIEQVKAHLSALHC